MPFNPGNKRAQRARNVPTVGGPMKFGLYPTVGVSLPFLMKLTRCCGPKNAACSGKREAVVACGASVQVCKACNVPLTCPADAPRGSCVSQEDIHKQVYPVVKGSCEPAGFAPRYCRDCCNKAGKGPGNGLALGREEYLALLRGIAVAAIEDIKESSSRAKMASQKGSREVADLVDSLFFANGNNQPPTFFGLSTAAQEEELQKLLNKVKEVMNAQIKIAKDDQENLYSALDAYLDNVIQQAKAQLSDDEKTQSLELGNLKKELAAIEARQVTDLESLKQKEADKLKKEDEIEKLEARFEKARDKSIAISRAAQDAKDDIKKASVEQGAAFRNMMDAVADLGSGLNLSGNLFQDTQTLLGRSRNARDQIETGRQDALDSSNKLANDLSSRGDLFTLSGENGEDLGSDLLSYVGDSQFLGFLSNLAQDLNQITRKKALEAWSRRREAEMGGHAGGGTVLDYILTLSPQDVAALVDAGIVTQEEVNQAMQAAKDPQAM